MKFSINYFFSKWTEEILNEKLIFMCTRSEASNTSSFLSRSQPWCWSLHFLNQSEYSLSLFRLLFFGEIVEKLITIDLPLS